MPSSPNTPRLRRRSSSFDPPLTPASIYGNGYSPKNTRSRKSSIQSFQSPITPRPTSSHGDYGFSNDFGGVTNTDNGLGSLADELAEAWDEDGEVEEGVSGNHMDGQDNTNNGHQENDHTQLDHRRDKEVVTSSSIQSEYRNGLLSLAKPVSRQKSRRKTTARSYEGSDYGSDFDLEDSGDIPPSLEIRMSAVESLARQGLESNGSEADYVCARVASSLRDLSSQAGVESGVTRYTPVRQIIYIPLKLMQSHNRPHRNSDPPHQSDTRPHLPHHTPSLAPLRSFSL